MEKCCCDWYVSAGNKSSNPNWCGFSFFKQACLKTLPAVVEKLLLCFRRVRLLVCSWEDGWSWWNWVNNTSLGYHFRIWSVPAQLMCSGRKPPLTTSILSYRNQTTSQDGAMIIWTKSPFKIIALWFVIQPLCLGLCSREQVSSVWACSVQFGLFHSFIWLFENNSNILESSI